MVHHSVTESIHLTSSDNRRVKALLRLRRQRDRRRTGLLVAEGVRQVTRARDAGLVMREFYWCPQLIDDSQPWFDDVRAGQRAMGQSMAARCFTVTPQLLARLAYRENPEGILAVFDQPRWRLEDLDGQGPGQWPSDLWLVAVGTQKPGNLGSMVRCAAAAGCNGVLVAGGVVDAFNPNAIHASTGAVFHVPVVAAPGASVLGFLGRRGVRPIAAVPGADMAYTDVDLTGPVALVVGPEDVGLDADWLTAAAPWPAATGSTEPGVAPVTGPVRGGCQVAIPMCGRTVDSLNAATAAAILLFEAVRQRAP